jgi:hypothetical protein
MTRTDTRCQQRHPTARSKPAFFLQICCVMSRPAGDVHDALIRLQSALDDLARALERDRLPAQPLFDRPADGWPADPRGLAGPRRLARVAFPHVRV